MLDQIAALACQFKFSPLANLTVGELVSAAAATGLIYFSVHRRTPDAATADGA